MYKPIFDPTDEFANVKARIAQFMSGSGTNVRRVLEQEVALGDDCPYTTAIIISDDPRPEKCNAEEIADEYRRLIVVCDIREIQEEYGLPRALSLATPKHRQARERFTKELAETLKPFDIDFGVFGGFVPLTNITGVFPCLNVHPGDLTYMVGGKPYLVGLHTEPIQIALDEGIGYVRSSVIQAMPYTKQGEDMDNGPVLGLGPKLFYEDETDPAVIQDKLKIVSDWAILPAVVLAAARGEISVDYDRNDVKARVVMDECFNISEVE